MQITIISGSHRQDAQSARIARYVQHTLLKDGLCDRAEIIDLANNPLPLWDESIWASNPTWEERLAPLRQQLAGSDALVVVAPEWHGMVPSGLKNFFLLFGWAELGHKPALPVAVSSVDGGAYVIAELRMSSYKNNRLCYLPEQVIVRNVEKVLHDDPERNDAEADAYFRQRFDYALRLLREYALSLRQVRASEACDFSTFGNGM